MSERSERAETPLGAMLREKGFLTPHERGVELWKMFHHTYQIMREIALEIERQEQEERR